MVLLAFLTYRIYRHYTNKGATATEPASPPKSRSHSGPVTPKTCSHSGPVLAYPGVSYSRLPRPMATLKHAAPMVVDAQRCPALPARASIVVKSMPTQLVAAPATIMGVRLSKESFTAAEAEKMMTSELSKMLEENEVTFAQSRGWLADAAAGARAGAKAEKKLELLLKEKAALQASLDSMRRQRDAWKSAAFAFRGHRDAWKTAACALKGQVDAASARVNAACDVGMTVARSTGEMADEVLPAGLPARGRPLALPAQLVMTEEVTPAVVPCPVSPCPEPQVSLPPLTMADTSAISAALICPTTAGVLGPTLETPAPALKSLTPLAGAPPAVAEEEDEEKVVGLLVAAAITAAKEELQKEDKEEEAVHVLVAAAIAGAKEELEKEQEALHLLWAAAANDQDQAAPSRPPLVSAAAAPSYDAAAAAAAGRRLPRSLTLEAVPEPNLIHAGLGWVADNCNWHERRAVGGAAGTPPGLRRTSSGSASTRSIARGSGDGFVSQVALSSESSESSRTSSGSTVGSLGRRDSSSCSSDDLGEFSSWPDGKQVGNSFAWTEKLPKGPDPLPERFKAAPKPPRTILRSRAGLRRAQGLAAASFECSSGVRALKSEAAAAKARAAAAAAAATVCKQPSSATQQRRAHKAATIAG